MRVIADLHLHSRFSRAVSREMNLPTMASWAFKKGIGILGTSDFTHPIWYREIYSQLKEVSEGVYRLRSTDDRNKTVDGRQSAVNFLLSTELSCIFSYKGKTRRIHIIILAPNFSTVEKINKALTERRVNLFSDGRPILGMTARDLTALILETNENCLIIPAHIWTPWFSLYGGMSGFDSIEECFADMTKNITAVETGLSSDPAMNWRMDELENRNIVSFGDAHSPAKLGREATVFEIPKMSYENIKLAIIGKSNSLQTTDYRKTQVVDRSQSAVDRESKILYTIEFYPEEGKYHFTGHRNCGVVYSPKEARKLGITCSVCGKPLTVGVMSRVEHLAKKEIEIEAKDDKYKVRWIKNKDKKRPPYIMLVPLLEILAQGLDLSASSKKALDLYDLLVSSFGGEFKVLMETNLPDIEKITNSKIAEAISKVRSGNIHIEPGYDGVFGKVKIWSPETKEVEEKTSIDQGVLF